MDISADSSLNPASVEHPQREEGPKNMSNLEKEVVKPLSQDDGVYYELDENDQIVRSQPQQQVGPPTRDDGVYYELDENDELVRMEPQQQPTGSSGSEASAATFSRQPGGKAAVVINVNQSGRWITEVSTLQSTIIGKILHEMAPSGRGKF